jgi:thiamine pyrophosphate-dependent acetolactate synthase large subunit-like protein
MADGFYRVTGRPLVIMVSVIVRTANGVSASMNAARAHVPMLCSAGRVEGRA